MTTPLKERVLETDETLKLPKPFIYRRVHSILGFWLVLYLFEHLLVNSQAALFFYDDGYAFVTAVNKINSLPYLRLIELLFLAVPFLFHGIWGMYYAKTAKLNDYATEGSKPSLPQYKRNRAFSWQRITSWLLVFGILAHVVHMRFVQYPAHYHHGDQQNFMVSVGYDSGLPLVAEKLNVKLFDQKQLDEKKRALSQDASNLAAIPKQEKDSSMYHPDDVYSKLLDKVENERAWLEGAEHKPLKKGEVLAAAPSIGAAIYLIVRETFKSPLLVILYSIFVIAATFHAFNGLWTFMIKWGITLTRRSQRKMRSLATILMFIVTFMGLMAIWGTYWTVLFKET